jgi:hypothetical protein
MEIWTKNAFRQLLFTEFRCLLRNRRLRFQFWMAILVLFLFTLMVIDWDNKQRESFFQLVYAGLMATLPVAMLGQFVFNKDGVFFDCIMAGPFSIHDYVKAKLSCLIICATLDYLIITPLLFFVAPLYAVMIVATMLYSIGVGAGLLCYCGTFDSAKIDYKQGALFNYAGISLGKQIIVMPPFFFLVFFPEWRYIGILSIAVCGIMGLLLLPKWVQLISHNVTKRKYRLIAGFRT